MWYWLCQPKHVIHYWLLYCNALRPFVTDSWTAYTLSNNGLFKPNNTMRCRANFDQNLVETLPEDIQRMLLATMFLRLEPDWKICETRYRLYSHTTIYIHEFRWTAENCRRAWLNISLEVFRSLAKLMAGWFAAIRWARHDTSNSSYVNVYLNWNEA